MKFFLSLLAIVACISAEHDWKVKTVDEIKAISEECLKEFHLTEEQIARMKNFEYPTEEATLKFLLCNSKKLGIFCSHTGYHADRFAKQFKMDMEEDEVKKVAEDCVSNNPKGDKSDELFVHDVHKCIMDSDVGDNIKAHIKKRREESH